MDAGNPVGPDSLAYLIHQFRQRTEHEMDRRADMRAGAVLAAIDGLWDDLARHGAAAPRPRPPQPCPEHCRDDSHFLTITKWDGSMDHTVHVDRLRIETGNEATGPRALVAYREIARASLLRVEPPDRPQPSREGTYVVVPPGAARVSAASVVEITPGERMTAMDDWRARQA